MAGPYRLDARFVHLGRGGSAVVQPAFTGLEWYEGYGARHDIDGPDGRLVSMHSFDESWDSWEMHPLGSEVVICTQGAMALVQEYPDGHVEQHQLAAGDYAINEPGVWHTADVVTSPATAIFITAGEGTQHRPR